MVGGARQSVTAAEAAARFARWRSGVLPPEEVEALAAWIEHSPLHKQAWVDLSDSWLGIEALSEDLTSRRAKRRRWAPAMMAGLAAASLALLVIGGAALGLRRESVSSPVPALPRVTAAAFETARGDRSTVVLNDGSLMTLDAASRAKVIIASDSRRVTLERGRAAFTVAKDASRPFIVTAGDQSVTATGTKFVVNVLPSEIGVGLVEGRVKVEKAANAGRAPAPGRIVELHPGDWLTATDRGGWTLASAEPANMLAWTSGVLIFQNASLAHIAAEMNRYAAAPIIIRDPETAKMRMSAVVTAGDTETIKNGVIGLGLAKVRRRTDGAFEFRAIGSNDRARLAPTVERLPVSRQEKRFFVAQLAGHRHSGL